MKTVSLWIFCLLSLFVSGCDSVTSTTIGPVPLGTTTGNAIVTLEVTSASDEPIHICIDSFTFTSVTESEFTTSQSSGAYLIAGTAPS